MVTSSDITSPAVVSLIGTGAAGGTFTLTVNGGSSASVTVANGSGTPATYQLLVTPGNGFGGTVVLNCTPVIAAIWASCSILPSSVILSGAVQVTHGHNHYGDVGLLRVDHPTGESTASQRAE